MLSRKREHPKIKSQLHTRNKHRERYDFKKLIQSCPELAPFVSLNKYDDESIDFFNPEAVMLLNKALLKAYYNIESWDIPEGYWRVFFLFTSPSGGSEHHKDYLNPLIPESTKILLDVV